MFCYLTSIRPHKKAFWIRFYSGQMSQKVVCYNEYLPARIYVFRLFFQIFTENHLSFQVSEIESCFGSHVHVLGYLTSRNKACAKQAEPHDFCGRDLVSPEFSWRCPVDQKARRLCARDCLLGRVAFKRHTAFATSIMARYPNFTFCIKVR